MGSICTSLANSCVAFNNTVNFLPIGTFVVFNKRQRYLVGTGHAKITCMWHAGGCSLTQITIFAEMSLTCPMCTGVVTVKLHGKCVDIHEVSWGPHLAACLA